MSAKPAASLPLFLGTLPILAVLIGLYAFNNAYLAVGIYHFGIIACLLVKNPSLPVFSPLQSKTRIAGLSFVCGLSFPAVYFLWPVIAPPDLELAELLSSWGISQRTVIAFCIYSITVHPVLEETFWRGLMPNHLFSDLLFALFHVFVLVKIIYWPWALLCFAVLVTASWFWRWAAKRDNNLVCPIFSHALADFGIVLAVFFLV